MLPANLGWDFGCFIEDVDHLFIIYDLTAAVAEGMNAYQVFLRWSDGKFWLSCM